MGLWGLGEGRREDMKDRRGRSLCIGICMDIMCMVNI